jgi:hypothetical protein
MPFGPEFQQLSPKLFAAWQKMVSLSPSIPPLPAIRANVNVTLIMYLEAWTRSLDQNPSVSQWRLHLPQMLAPA